MKRLIFIAATVLFAASCSNEIKETEEPNITETYAPVHVAFSDFTVSHEDFPGTRATKDAAEYTNIKALTLAFYDAEGVEVYRDEQIRSNTSSYSTFGEFECELPIGVYTLVAIGRGMSDGDVFVLTSPSLAEYTTDKARETLVNTQRVVIRSAIPVDIPVPLDRICAKLNVVSTDSRPANITKIRTTYAAGGQSFNPTSGLATTNTGFSLVNNFSSAPAVVNFGSYIFLTSDEQDIDVTIEALDAQDNVLFTKVFNDLSFKRNRSTKVTGSMFSVGASSFSIKVNSDWLDDYEVSF